MINNGTINNALTRGNKSEIVGWGTPDYGSGVSKNMNTQYTSETNGILFVYGYRGNGTTSPFIITINGVELVSAAMNDYNIYANNFLLKKGDIYQTNNPVGTYNLKFFPLIGG